jgi:hypothetical protein
MAGTVMVNPVTPQLNCGGMAISTSRILVTYFEIRRSDGVRWVSVTLVRRGSHGRFLILIPAASPRSPS